MEKEFEKSIANLIAQTTANQLAMTALLTALREDTVVARCFNMLTGAYAARTESAMEHLVLENLKEFQQIFE
jgi:hypothetical protein